MLRIRATVSAHRSGHSTADHLELAKLERIREPVAFCITTIVTRSGGTAEQTGWNSRYFVPFIGSPYEPRS